MGHEGTGTVVELGAGLEHDALGQPLRPGDRVVWAHNWCGRCYFCAVAKQPTLCENTMGYGWGPYEEGAVNGTFSEHLHISPDSRVLRVPEGVSSPARIGGHLRPAHGDARPRSHAPASGSATRW